MKGTQGGEGGPARGATEPVPVLGAALTEALRSATEKSRPAGKLLHLAAYMASREIPLDLFTGKTMSAGEVHVAADALAGAGLARWTSPHDGLRTIDVAVAVQAELRERHQRSGEAQVLAAGATRLLAEAFPHDENDPGESRHWPVCQRLDPHVRAVLDYAPDEGEGAEATSRLLHAYSMYLFARGKLEDAEQNVRRAGAVAELVHGPGHPRVGQDCADLAILLYELGRVEEALPLIRRSMAIDEANFGPEHPLVAERYNMLATLLVTLGRPAEADPYIRHAVLAAERALGAGHPDTQLYRENYEKVIASIDRIARRDDAVEAGLAPPPPERLARPDIPPPPAPRREPSGLLGRFRRKSD